PVPGGLCREPRCSLKTARHPGFASSLVPIPGGHHRRRGATWPGHEFLYGLRDSGHRAKLVLPSVPDKEPNEYWSSCRGWLERGESVRVQLAGDTQESGKKSGSLPIECFAFPVSYGVLPPDFRGTR